MRHIRKHLAALLCAAAVALALLPAQAWAQPEESSLLTVSETQDNPLYPAQVTADDSNGTSLLAAGGMSSFDTAAQAADYITQQFKARENMAFFYTGYPADGPFLALTADEESAAYSDEEQELVRHGASRADILQRRQLLKYVRHLVTEELLPEAFRYTPDDPTGGDYMRTQYRDVTYAADYDGYTFGVSVTFTYFTTAAQEAEADEAAEELLDFLQIGGKTDYAKLQAIYGWLCGHVAYDYAHQKDDTYLIKNSAYGALVDKAAVGQGYAALLYRLALASGVETRIVTGTGRGEAHHWNLVKLGSKWYYADASWDVGRQSWSYFLQPSLLYHVPDDASLAVIRTCPLSATAFSTAPGRLNRDDSIDILDVQLLYTYLATGAVPQGDGVLPEGDFRLAADVNADGTVDVYDLQTLYETACGLR